MARPESGQFLNLTRHGFNDLKKLIQVAMKPLGKRAEKEGVVYAAATYTPSQQLYIKVGWSEGDGRKRVNDIKTRCHISVCDSDATLKFRGAYRAEQIIHAFLAEYNVLRIMCPCKSPSIKHYEWFQVQPEYITKLINMVYHWMVTYEPYDDSGMLKDECKAEIDTWSFNLLYTPRMSSQFNAQLSGLENSCGSSQMVYQQNNTPQLSVYAEPNMCLYGTSHLSLPENATPTSEGMLPSNQYPDRMDYTTELLNNEQPPAELLTLSSAQINMWFLWMYYRDLRHNTDSTFPDTSLQSKISVVEANTAEYVVEVDSRTIDQLSTKIAGLSLEESDRNTSAEPAEVQWYRKFATNTSLDGPDPATLRLGEELKMPVATRYSTGSTFGSRHLIPDSSTLPGSGARATLEPPCSSSVAETSRTFSDLTDSGTGNNSSVQRRRNSSAFPCTSEANPALASGHGRSRSDVYVQS